eukprot:750635-Ditylum_brightwellii.AAC.1
MLDTYQTNKSYVTQITKSVSDTVKKSNLLPNKPPKSAWSQGPPKAVRQQKGKSDNSSTFSNQSKASSVTRPTVLNTKVKELREDTAKKFAASDVAFKVLKDTITTMNTNHSQQLHEIKEMLSTSDTQISNELTKTAALEVAPEII